jgi:hypothetical protein
MVLPVGASAPVVPNTSSPSTQSVAERSSTAVSDNGESRRISASTTNFVREAKEDQEIRDENSEGLAVKQELNQLQAAASQNSYKVPSILIPGPPGTNVDFYV